MRHTLNISNLYIYKAALSIEREFRLWSYTTISKNR